MAAHLEAGNEVFTVSLCLSSVRASRTVLVRPQVDEPKQADRISLHGQLEPIHPNHRRSACTRPPGRARRALGYEVAAVGPL